MFSSTLFKGYSQFTVFMAIMVCSNTFSTCQTAGDSGTTGYYSFSIKTIHSYGQDKIECSAKLHEVNVSEVFLNGSAYRLFDGCACQVKVGREASHGKVMQWVISSSGNTRPITTVYINQSWFKETHAHFIWRFNITSEPQGTKITYMENQQTRKTELLSSEQHQIRIGPTALNTPTVDLECQRQDAADSKSKDTTEMFIGHASPLEKTTVVVITEPTKSQSIKASETSKWTARDAPNTTTTNMPLTSTHNDRNDVPLSPSGEKSDTVPKTITYIVIATVAGGLFLVVLVVVIVVCIIRKRQHSTAEKRPGSSPTVLYSNLDQVQTFRNDTAKISPNTTDDDEQLLNQSEAVATTYADIDPKSLVRKDMETQETPGTGQGQEQGLTYADLDWVGNNPKQSNAAPDAREELYAKPNKTKT